MRSLAAFGPIAFVVLALGAGCGSEDADADSADNAISSDKPLEQTPLPTALKELRAGTAYIPGIDEAPKGGGANCVPSAKVEIRNGQAATTAAILHSRRSLNVELGLEASGNVPVLGGLTGAASLAAKTTFDSRSASILFRATGTYESNLSADAAPPNFDVAKVGTCGLGYVLKARHRVTAAFIVSMHSKSMNIDVNASANIGKPSVDGKPSLAEAKGSLKTIIQRGDVEVEVRFANDAIPNLPNPPAAASSVLTEDPATALGKIETALGWLEQANGAINTYLVALQGAEDPLKAGPPAPAQEVDFRFYPNTPGDVRQTVETLWKDVEATKTSIADGTGLIASWDAFTKSAKAGNGFHWNIQADPTDSVDALTKKATTTGGQLHSFVQTASNQLQGCMLALRNDPAAPGLPEFVATLKDKCKAPPSLPVDHDKADIRPLATGSIAETSAPKCEAGYRLPKVGEQKLFNAWSVDANAKSEGLWVQDGSCGAVSGAAWLLNGKIACSGFLAHTGVAVCIPEKGPFPADPE